MKSLIEDLNKVVVALNAKNIKIAEATAQEIDNLVSEVEIGSDDIFEKKLEKILRAFQKVNKNESKREEKIYVDVYLDGWGNTGAYLTRDRYGVGVTPKIEPSYIVVG